MGKRPWRPDWLRRAISHGLQGWAAELPLALLGHVAGRLGSVLVALPVVATVPAVAVLAGVATLLSTQPAWRWARLSRILLGSLAVGITILTIAFLDFFRCNPRVPSSVRNVLNHFGDSRSVPAPANMESLILIAPNDELVAQLLPGKKIDSFPTRTTQRSAVLELLDPAKPAFPCGGKVLIPGRPVAGGLDWYRRWNVPSSGPTSHATFLALGITVMVDIKGASDVRHGIVRAEGSCGFGVLPNLLGSREGIRAIGHRQPVPGTPLVATFVFVQVDRTILQALAVTTPHGDEAEALIDAALDSYFARVPHPCASPR